MNTGAERIPKSGELYRHFKDKLYQIVAVAEHSETGEALVIYQALYGDYKVYARPLEMFTSEVDHVKYPAVEQKYRFERVEREALEPSCVQNTRQSAVSGGKTAEGRTFPTYGAQKQQERTFPTHGAQKQQERTFPVHGAQKQVCAEDDGHRREAVQQTAGSAAQEDGVNPKLLAFFDADTLEEKYNIVISMRDEVDNHLINSMAVVLDVVIPEGEVDERYEQLKSCIRTKQRYETQRLR